MSFTLLLIVLYMGLPLCFYPCFGLKQSQHLSVPLTSWPNKLFPRIAFGLDCNAFKYASNVSSGRSSFFMDYISVIKIPSQSAQNYWNFNCCTVRDKRKCSLLLMYWYSMTWRQPGPRTRKNFIKQWFCQTWFLEDQGKQFMISTKQFRSLKEQ